MDTIIYVYWKREEPSSEEKDVSYWRQDLDMGFYHLVKIGVPSKLWQILSEQSKEKVQSSMGEQRELFRSRRYDNRRHRKQTAVRERCRQKFLQELLVDREHSYFVTDEPIPILEGWSFRGYWEEQWVMHLMEYAVLNHFVLLGTTECIPVALLRYVRKMKTLRWILLRRQYRETEQELAEIICEEYGLAVDVRLLEEEKEYRRMAFVCPFPVVVVDFSEEPRIPVADVARNSIWLDMSALEEKRRRIEERNTGIAYFSLKKEWKQPEKALYQLDTISKNGYNT